MRLVKFKTLIQKIKKKKKNNISPKGINKN